MLNRRKKRKRRLKKPVKYFLCGTASISAIVCVAMLMNVFDVGADGQALVNVTPVYNIGYNDIVALSNAKSSLIETVYEESSNSEAALVQDQSSALFAGLDPSTTGLQVVNSIVDIVDSDGASIGNTVSKTVAVNVSPSYTPTLTIFASEISIKHGQTFKPESYITLISDDSGIYPSLSIESNVDTSVDGQYSVNYRATNIRGYSTEATMIVNVYTTDEQLAMQEVYENAEYMMSIGNYEGALYQYQSILDYADAAGKAEEAQRLLDEFNAKSESEQMAYLESLSANFQESVAEGSVYYGYSSGNPYAGGWGNCTYGAWEALYEARGIALPGFGNAGEWYANAAAAGYSVSSFPTAGGIIVWGGGNTGLGHVAYVDAVQGGMVHIIEGNYNGHANSRWVNPYRTDSLYLIGFINV